MPHVACVGKTCVVRKIALQSEVVAEAIQQRVKVMHGEDENESAKLVKNSDTQSTEALKTAGNGRCSTGIIKKNLVIVGYLKN